MLVRLRTVNHVSPPRFTTLPSPFPLTPFTYSPILVPIPTQLPYVPLHL